MSKPFLDQKNFGQKFEKSEIIYHYVKYIVILAIALWQTLNVTKQKNRKPYLSVTNKNVSKLKKSSCGLPESGVTVRKAVLAEKERDVLNVKSITKRSAIPHVLMIKNQTKSNCATLTSAQSGKLVRGVNAHNHVVVEYSIGEKNPFLIT